jgi:hypothetical protein
MVVEPDDPSVPPDVLKAVKMGTAGPKTKGKKAKEAEAKTLVQFFDRSSSWCVLGFLSTCFGMGF